MQACLGGDGGRELSTIHGKGAEAVGKEKLSWGGGRGKGRDQGMESGTGMIREAGTKEQGMSQRIKNEERYQAKTEAKRKPGGSIAIKHLNQR